MMTVLLLTAFFILVSQCMSAQTENLRPIVGILAQSASNSSSWKKYGDSYIETSYVGYLEQAGARVVPVKVNEPDAYYRDLFSKINGVLFPGGGVSIMTSYYAKAAKLMYDMAIEANDKGDYFPLWGTCLGFEQLPALTAGKYTLSKCEGENIRLPLDFTRDSNESRLLKGIPNYLTELLTKVNITYNAHQYCVTEKTFYDDPNLREFYRVISTNKDKNGLGFISTMEGYKYPFYGIQWHAEKNNWDWYLGDDIDHSEGAALISQYMANFFIQEARKSGHKFPSPEAEAQALIQAGESVYLGQPRFYSLYVFNFTKEEQSHQTHLHRQIQAFPDYIQASVARLQFVLVMMGTLLMFTSIAMLLRHYYRRGTTMAYIYAPLDSDGSELPPPKYEP